MDRGQAKTFLTGKKFPSIIANTYNKPQDNRMRDGRLTDVHVIFFVCSQNSSSSE